MQPNSARRIDEEDVAALSEFLDPVIFELFFSETEQTKQVPESTSLLGRGKIRFLLAVNLSSPLNKN